MSYVLQLFEEVIDVAAIILKLQGTEQSLDIWAPILVQHESLSCLTSSLKDH